jgi:hypothetical protein
MKRWIAAFLWAGAVASPCVAAAEPVQEVTGIEWLQMSMTERMEQILLSMAILAQSGVQSRRTPLECYDLVHDAVRRGPAQHGRRLSRILADKLYDTEPAVRLSLDRLRAPAAPAS